MAAWKRSSWRHTVQLRMPLSHHALWLWLRRLRAIRLESCAQRSKVARLEARGLVSKLNNMAATVGYSRRDLDPRYNSVERLGDFATT